MDIPDLLNEERVSGAHSGRASLYIRQEVLITLPPLALRVWGNDMHDQYINIQHSDDPTSGLTILYWVNKH